MMIQMRPYQAKAIQDIHRCWHDGNQFVVLVMPTGSGKSATLCELAKTERDDGQVILILAHRKELITQLSHTLARNGLNHNILAARKTVKSAHRQQVREFGKSFVTPNSKVFVGSVQSLKPEEIKRFSCYKNKLTMIQDEFHHATKKSKTWGNILTPLDAAGAKGLGVTATPCRADGQGLSRETDGYGDCLVLGPTARELIEMGYLSDYRVFSPPSDLNLNEVLLSKTTGDYQEKSLKAEIGKSHIVGDIVENYIKIANGKPGLTFTVGIEMAERVAEQYRNRGIPAIALSGNSADNDREQAIRDIQTGKILQIVNDMLFTEGTDIPCVEVITFARPTQSYGLYCQMFGRGLRPADGKSHAIIIDHVGNVARHGLPDAKREWSLDRREKNSSPGDVEPIRTCVDHKTDGIVMTKGCFAAFPKYLRACDICGLEVATPTPAERTGPEHVDGDLLELDAETLARMRGEVAKVDRPMDEAIAEYRADLMRRHTPTIGVMAHTKRFAVKLEAQQEAIGALREIMALWAGHHRAAGRDDGEIFRRFYLRYGVDWLSAQALSSEAALSLGSRVAIDIGSM